MNQFATRASIVRLSDSDFAFLYGGHEYAKRAEALFAADTKLFIVTRGIRGAQAWHKRAGAIEVETPQVEVVDTIGAGDSFQAGLLFALRTLGRIAPRALAEMTAHELHRAVTFATKCAAFTCGRRGADPPHLFEIGAATFADELQTDPGDRTATRI